MKDFMRTLILIIAYYVGCAVGNFFGYIIFG